MPSPLPREHVLGLKSFMATRTIDFIPSASPSIAGNTLRGRATSGEARLGDLYNTYAKHQMFTGAADARPFTPVERFEVRYEPPVDPDPKPSVLERRSGGILLLQCAIRELGLIWPKSFPS